MKLLAVKEAALLIGTSDQTIRNWIEEKKIKPYEDGDGKLLVDKNEVLLQTPTVITFFNQKGGVGKTSMSLLIADYFEKQKYKTLLVDLDQQGNLSQTYFKYEDIKNNLTLFDYFYNRTPLNKIVKNFNKYIDVLPADIKLSRKDNISVEDLLDLKNDFLPIFKKYQIVIIDCPPALNSLSRFGILLANYIFCPVHPSAYSFDGSFEVLRTIKKFIPGLNKDCIDYKFFISKHHSRRIVIKDEYIDLYKKEYDGKIFNNTVPEFVGIEERAVSFKNLFDMYSSDEKAMRKLKKICDEIRVFIFDERK